MSLRNLTRLFRSEKVVLFLHIPKCAGLSLYRIIADQYPGGRVFVPRKRHFENAREIDGLGYLRQWAIRAICAHMPFGAHRYIDNATYLTMLRDPVGREIKEAAFASVASGGGLCVLAGNVAYGEKISLDPFDLIKGRRNRPRSGPALESGRVSRALLNLMK